MHKCTSTIPDLVLRLSTHATLSAPHMEQRHALVKEGGLEKTLPAQWVRDLRELTVTVMTACHSLQKDIMLCLFHSKGYTINNNKIFIMVRLNL